MIWAGGAIVGWIIASGLNLGGTTGPIAGVLGDVGSTNTKVAGLGDSKWLPWMASLAIYGFIAMGGAGVAAKMAKGSGITGGIGHFVSGFGVGGLFYELLSMPA